MSVIHVVDFIHKFADLQSKKKGDKMKDKHEQTRFNAFNRNHLNGVTWAAVDEEELPV